MNPFCPNLSNPQVKKEFDELKDIFGEDLAYFLWDKNEGYSLDRTPTGVRSALYLSHLRVFNGNRVESLKAVAKDLIQGKSHDDAEYHPDATHPLEQINQTIDSIGLSNLIDTITSVGVDINLAKAVYKAAKETKNLRSLKPIDIYNIISQQRDASLKDEYNKRVLAPINRALEKHLISILYRYGFQIKDLGDLITQDESINLENLAGAYDIFNKIIYLANNRNEMTMPEEFAHAFIKMMGAISSKAKLGKNELPDTYAELYELVTNIDIYKQVYDQYKDIYVYHNISSLDGRPYTKVNERKIREEAIGQALAVLIVNKWNEEHSTKSQEDISFFKKLKNWFNNILNKFNNKLLNQEDREENANQLDFEALLNKLADDIVSGEMKSIDYVDDSNYSLLNYSQTIHDQNEKDGGIALNFMKKHVEWGCNISGSLSYRFQGTIYRSKKDSLHDIDMSVPYSVHKQTPFAYWNEAIEQEARIELEPMWKIPKEERDEAWKKKMGEISDKYAQRRVDYLINEPFFKQIQTEYPDMIFMTAYVPGNGWDGITVSSVWSTDNELSKRFAEMRGSYADRLSQFTQEEQDKIYLFDYFLTLDEDILSLKDEENDVSLDNFARSFVKKLEMGRKKDLFDYQRWQVFEKYKNLYIPTADTMMFQEQPSSISETVNKTVQDNGKIRLSLTSHTENNPRQIVLEPQGNNKFYVHLRIWDGEHIAGNISNEDKRKLFDALYNELPDGAEILFPKSGEGYYGTRGTVAGLMRLSRDPRFIPGKPGVLYYKDNPNDEQVKTYEGTSFIKTSQLGVNNEIQIFQNKEEYVTQKLSEYMNDNPGASDDQINIKRREYINEYVQNAQRSLISDSARRLAEAFGLVKQEDGSWMSYDENDPIAKLRVEFVNKIDDIHSGSYEHNPLSISAHHIIRIGLDKGDPTTFNHEMAHHYVRLFWNSSLIQEALKMVDKPGMTDIQREEALVDKMVEISINNVYGTIFNNKNFFHVIWNKFANLLYSVFDIKTETVRRQLMENVTNAFLLNDQLSAIEDERVLFNMQKGIVYQSKALKKLNERKQKQQKVASYKAQITSKDEELTESIIKHTENKDKAYSRRGGVNEQQVLKLQEAVYAVHRSAARIKDALATNNIEQVMHEKAKLILDYMDRAAEEIADSVSAFNSAMANNYRQFVFNANPDGTFTFTEFGERRKDITFDDLVNIKSDILNFHANIIGRIGDMLSDINSVKQFSSEDIEQIKDKFNTLDLNRMVGRFENMFNTALDQACIRDIIQYIDKNVDLEDDLKTRLKINMLKWLRDQNDFGDVSIYEQWIGLGSHSKSPIIRMMQDIINDLMYERDTPVEKKGKELVTLLDKARKSTTTGVFDISKYNIKIGKFNLPTPWNIQKLLMEMDEIGLPTGNLISRINRGKYHRNKENFLAELLYGKDGNGGIEQEIRELVVDGKLTYSDFELELDKYSVPIFPDDPAIEQIAKKYYRAMEKWRCENEDRQYTQKYYMDRIDSLSASTLRALDQIQSRVGEIYSVCTIKGIVRTDLLSNMQKNELQDLRMQRAQLYNFYNVDGSLKAEGSEERKMAEELAEWSMKTRGKIVYKIDREAFRQAMDIAKNKQRFYDENTVLVINPKVWDYYKRIMGDPVVARESDPDVQKLNKLIYKRNKMLAQIKANGFGFTNMSELWDEDTKTLKNRQFWVNLRKLETSIHNLRATLKDRYRTGSKKENKDNFGKVFNSIYNPIDEHGAWYGNNVPRWINHIHKALKATSPEDIKLLYLEGTSEPLSIFSTLVPYYKVEGDGENKKYVQTDDLGQTYDILIREPNSNFSVLDIENSSDEYVNKDYHNEDGKTYKPKESVYLNKEFDKFEQPGALKDLYDGVLNTMTESWSKFPFLHEYDYRLPQMRGRTGQILGRRRNIFKSIGYQLSSWWEINETDEWMNNDFQTRPDGSRIDFVPIRFIKRLERPEYISSDVVGSVISFFEMAKNFEVKSKTASQFEAYLTKFQNNEMSAKQSWHNVPQSKILSHMTDVQLYGREQDLVVDSKKKDKHGSNKVKGWMKRIRASRGWAQASLLAHNYASAIVSFLDPLLSVTLDMATGKFTNYRDFFFALGVMFSDLPRAVGSLGRVHTYSKANAAMQYFQLGKNNNATFKNLDKSQFYRFMSDDLGMKMFTLGDYTISCITMISTMNNYKLYEYKDSTAENPHKKFLKKEEFIKEALNDGRTEDEARDMYNQWFSHTSLWDAFELRNGRFQVKDEYADFIDSKTMSGVRKQAQSRSSIYNGVVPDAEKTRLQTNLWTSFITMLRNFFIMGINERFKNLRDFQVADYEKYQILGIDIESGNYINSTPEAIERAKKEQSILKGGYNFSTRTIEDGVFTGFGNVLRRSYGQAKYYLGFMARNAEENNQSKEDIYKLSEFDKYAGKKVALELGTIAALLILATFINGKADEDPDDYWMQLLALILTRLPSERITFYSPTLISDLITSPTSAVSAYRRFLRITDLSMDLIGLSDYDIDDDIKYGSYAGQKRWFRDVCGIFSNYGLHNAYTNTNTKSLKAKNKYYKKLLPIRTTSVDALLEIFGIDLAPDKTSNNKSKKAFGNEFKKEFKNEFKKDF